MNHIIYDIIFFLTVYCALPIFVFFLVTSLGLKELDSKLKCREITHNLFKKLF